MEAEEGPSVGEVAELYPREAAVAVLDHLVEAGEVPCHLAVVAVELCPLGEEVVECD